MKKHDIILIKKWLKDTYMEDAKILKYKVYEKQLNILKRARLILELNNVKVAVNITSDKHSLGNRASSCYYDDKGKKIIIDGAELRDISERRLV